MNHVDPKSLTIHPEAQAVPGLPSAQYAALRESVRRLGIRQPLLADAEGRVIDGRNRLAIALEIGLEAVPVDQVTGEDAAMVAVESAVARRNLTTSGRVLVLYVAHPALARGGVRESSMANLKKGESRSCPRTTSGESKENGTFASLGDRYQVPSEYFSKLAEIEAKCGGDAGKWEGVKAAILGGEISIPRVNAGVGGAKATEGKKRSDPDYAMIAWRSAKSLGNAFEQWGSLKPDAAERAAEAVGEAVRAMPERCRHLARAAILEGWPAAEQKHLLAALKRELGA